MSHPKAAHEDKQLVTSLEADFGLRIHPKSSGSALARRLFDHTLRPTDQTRLVTIRRVLDAQAAGKIIPQIAADCGMSPQNLRNFMKTEHFRITAQFLHDQAQKPGTDGQRERQQSERAEWNALAPKSLDYYRDAFARDADGAYVSVERAERAAGLVAKGQGWTEPEPPAPKPQTLKLGVIQAAMQAIAASDRGETVVRMALEVTTTRTGAEGTSEPAAGDV